MLKSNRILKIAVILAAIVAIVTISTVVNASGFVPTTGLSAKTGSGTNMVFNIGSTVLGIVQAVGYVVAVVILVWLGVKYIMASPDGKADIKKQAFAYILGAILLFAASTIVGIISSVANTISATI